MTPDITIKDYYLQFIYNAKIDFIEYNKNIDTIKIKKDKIYNYINQNYNTIKNKFNITLNNYDKEWNNKIYNNSEQLYQIVIKKLSITTDDNDRNLLMQIIKYCNLLRNEYKYDKLIKLANTRKNIKFNTYRKYINEYYIKVHKFILEGMGYKFGYGIGTYIINHWKLDVNRMKHKPHLDYAATNAKKKELIAKGVKLYDDKEAAWYAARKIPYSAVDYRVYKETTDWYEFTFMNSKFARNNNLEYKRTEYIVYKYRGMSYKDMADKLCKTLDDIYNLQVDIKYKLNILLYKYPNKYLNYIRNAEQYKYKYRKDNS